MKISASVYSDKNRSLKETINDLVDHQVDLLHIDCNDDPTVFEDIKKIKSWCSLPIDLHLITNEPKKYASLLKETPVEYVTYQFEAISSRKDIPENIPGEQGLAIVTPTSVDVFEEFNEFDFLLLMATTPGESGGKFNAQNFHKIREFKSKFPNKNVHVDGGVNGEVSFILRNLGVHASVSGSFLFNAPSVGQALMDLTKREIKSSFKLKDFMIPRNELPIIDFNELTLEKALKQIESGNLGVSFVENNEEFIGIISNADIRRGLIKYINQIYDMPMKEIINKSPVTIEDEANVNDMLEIVREQTFPVSYLPVLDKEGKSVGIISFVNLIKGEI